jgi:predicted acylesterase/phospholipase RssA
MAPMSGGTLALTLAGGGNRAFYQLGLLRKWGPRLVPELGVIAACSAGACVGALFFSGRADLTAEFWKKRREGVTRNLDVRRLFRGERLAPHADVYRDTMVFAMQEGGLDRIRALPFPLLVLTAGLPRRTPALAAVALGLGAYNLEKQLAKERIHPTFGRRLGFVPHVFDARACETPESVADLVLASSATPPFTPVGLFDGKRLLDGGMIDNVPAFVAESHPGVERNLIVLTRPYPEGAGGRQGMRWYVGPATPTPVGRWDYTQPHLVDRTIEMGEVDGDRRLAELDAFLSR